ncbi:ParA family protein [Terasakiella sp. SH-1]|uniref:ParA family protein n=1 Tax=Terasakiella sp. SH-1 TaxID=2560057 RepID=UPI001072F014|nr:ParA family protein [Terasakiella sp. SH-1]
MVNYIIGIVGQKGGAGKSTLARGIATEAARQGYAVKIADFDLKQSSCMNWRKLRLENGLTPDVPVESYNSVEKALAANEGADLLIIDQAGRGTTLTLDIAKVADVIIQPTRASIDDLDPAVKVFHELKRAGIPKDRLKMAFSHIGTDAELLDVRAYVEEAGYSYLDGCLFERPAYRKALNRGAAPTETPFLSLNKKARAFFISAVNACVDASK